MGFLNFEIPFWNIKFGLGQEKSPKIKKVPKYLELIERFHIFAASKRKFWLSG